MVDYINKNRQDNRSDNLRWMTKSKQVYNRTPNQRRGKPVLQCDLQGNLIQKWDRITDAARTIGVTNGIINQACRDNTQLCDCLWGYYYENEMWYVVPYLEYDTVYASTYGRLFTSSNEITFGSIKNGYSEIELYNNFTEKYDDVKVHRLIAATFGGRNDNLIVNHKDGNGLNNKPDNLEYVIYQENEYHVAASGCRKGNSKGKKVLQLDLDGNIINQFETIIKAANETHTTYTGIGMVCNGTRKISGGVKWSYA